LNSSAFVAYYIFHCGLPAEKVDHPCHIGYFAWIRLFVFCTAKFYFTSHITYSWIIRSYKPPLDNKIIPKGNTFANADVALHTHTNK
jgi:hypothetical protein